jgi:RNA polymerase sigma-70 factor (ECF subfamily)
MAETTQEFAGLLVRCRRGDENALEELARRYEPEVRIVARVLLGPALRPYLDSVDLVQSVHKSLMLGLRADKFDISCPEKLVALTVEMVRRKVGRHWRHLQRQKRLDSGRSEGGDWPQLFVSLHSTETDPARAAQLKDTVQHFYKSLDRTEQRLMEMRLQGFSSDEIATELGLSPIALRVRLSRLRQRLKATGKFDNWL